MMMSLSSASVARMKVTAIVSLALAATTIVAAGTEHDIGSRRARERTTFTDAEITEGFLKTAFGAELRLAGAANDSC
jgi:hypothetical protein